MMLGIKVEALKKVYTSWRGGKQVTAVDGIDFMVARGEILGLLGPNGAGKTTTVKMICGLVTPTAGTILVNGYDLASQRQQVLASIGVVLEGNRNVYWRLTPQENLEYFAKLRGLSPRAIATRRDELLRLFDLWDRRADTVETLSRGMQQKVALAVALVGDPPVLLFDEPTAGLDVPTAEVVKQQIVHLAKEEGRAILLTTHQMELAQAICDRVAIINQGKIVVQDRVDRLLELFAVQEYRLQVSGHLTDAQRARLAGVDGVIIREKETHTELTLTLDKMEILYGLIDILKENRVPILSIEREEPNLAEVFLNAIQRKG